MNTILFAGNFLSASTGIVGISEELAPLLRRRGWHVITASHHLNRVLRMLDFWLTALKYRKDYQIVVVEVYSFGAFRWAELLCLLLRRLKKSYCLTLHGGRLPEFAEQYPRRFRKLIQSAAVVTTPSQYLKKEFSNIQKDIHYIPNGINLHRYEYHDLENISPFLVWMHGIGSAYNPQLAIKVMTYLMNEYPDAKLRMIGPDSGDGTLDAVRALGEDLGVINNITITGAIKKDQVNHYFQEGCIYINTTNYESFGIAVMEAAACGLCIVTTNVGEMPYLWEDGVDALLVPPDDPVAMTEAVLRILGDAPLARRLSRNARKKAENYDWGEIIPRYEAVFIDGINHGMLNQYE